MIHTEYLPGFPKYLEYNDFKSLTVMYQEYLDIDNRMHLERLEYSDYLEYFLSLCSSHKLHPCLPTLASTCFPPSIVSTLFIELRIRI